jgi:hypothetical protein
MVELKYDRIGLAAIHAWVQCKVRPHSPLVFRKGHGGCCLNPGEVTLTISQVPEALVLDETVLAPRVTYAELDIPETELIDWLLDVASAADLRFRLHRTCILSHASGRNNHIDTEIQTATRDSSVRETTTTRVCDTRVLVRLRTSVT